MNISFKGNNIQIISREFNFDLNWSFLFSNVVDINAINAQNITVQYTGKEGKGQKFTVDSFAGRIKTSCCDVDVPSFKLKTGDNLIQGKFNIGLQTNVPRIKGTLNANQWSLPLSSSDTPKEKPMTEQAFPLQWINDVEGQIDLHVNKLLLNDKPIQNVDINFNLKNKTLVITPQAKIEGGKVNGKLTVKQNTDATIQMDVALDVINANAKPFLRKIQS